MHLHYTYMRFVHFYNLIIQDKIEIMFVIYTVLKKMPFYTFRSVFENVYIHFFEDYYVCMPAGIYSMTREQSQFCPYVCIVLAIKVWF